MNKGRGKDHVWRFVRFRGDIGIYAKCRCGYFYHCSKIEHPDGIGIRSIIDVDKIFPYCPNCGARKTRYETEVREIDRYMFEYLGEKYETD